MKEFSNKKPYLSPQLTVVEFRMEVGYSESDVPEISQGIKSLEVESTMYFLGQQAGTTGPYMGTSGSYASSGYFDYSFGGDAGSGSF